MLTRIVCRNGRFHTASYRAGGSERGPSDVPIVGAVVIRASDPVPTGRPAVRVRRSGIPDADNGVFAATVFERRDVITEYVGQTVTLAEATALPVQTHLVSLNRLLKIAGIRRPVHGRGGGSFANDCAGCEGFAYNAEKLLSADGTRLFLRATRHIAADEEIFWPYGGAGRVHSTGRAVAMGSLEIRGQ